MLVQGASVCMYVFVGKGECRGSALLCAFGGRRDLPAGFPDAQGHQRAEERIVSLNF